MSTYQRYYHTVRDLQGNVVYGASCAVYQAGTSTLATIYDASSTDAAPSAKANPFTVGSDGVVSFFALDGQYDVQITGGSMASVVQRITLSTADAGVGAVSSADLADTSSALKGDELVGVKSTLAGGVARTQHDKNAEFVSILDFGAVSGGDPVTNKSAILAALATLKRVYIPAGTYDYVPPIDFNNDSHVVYGDGRYRSILKPTSAVVPAMRIAQTSSVNAISFSGFQVSGNATCTTGIQVGDISALKYAVDVRFEDFYCKGFTGTGAAGIEVQYGWWINLDGVALEGNYHNLHIPTGATVTTLSTHGWCKFTSATNACVNIGVAGLLASITFNNTDFSNNQYEVIRSTGKHSQIFFTDCYYEQNSKNASSPGVFNIVGGTAYDYIQLVIKGGRTDAPVNGYMMSLDYVKSSTIKDCFNFSSGAIITTANCEIKFENMNSQTATDFLATARTLLGDITVIDRTVAVASPYSVETYSSRGSYFEGHLGTYQPNKPTIAAKVALGTGAAAVVTDGSTDTNGRLELTAGSASWSSGAQASVSFNKNYIRAPRVLLFPASAKAAGNVITQQVYVSNITVSGFDIYYGNAETAAGLAYWNYIVIE